MRPSPAEPTSPDSDRCSPSSRAYAATGTWQLPCNARFIARSASTRTRVSAWSSTASSPHIDASPSRHSIAIAPCAGAGNHCGASSRARMRCSNPSRIRPAQARTMASYSPPSSLPRRVPTLPRRSRSSRSGRSARSCACRRSEEVPTRAPGGNASMFAKAFDTKASAGSSRSRIAGRANPGSSSIGTSLSECTAQSDSPRCIDSSSSLRNRPLPPIAASERSSTSSPRVLIGTSSTASPGCAARSRAATCSLCHSASGLLRVAMRRRSMRGLSLFTPPLARSAGGGWEGVASEWKNHPSPALPFATRKGGSDSQMPHRLP